VVSQPTVLGLERAVKDPQTVTSDGALVQDEIDGVLVRHSPTHADERGTLTEVFDRRWEFTTEPVGYVYTSTVRPNQVRGWVVHLEQDDRLFFVKGTAKLALYDAREGSGTFGRVNVHYLGDHDRALVRIPAGVVHAVKNAGDHEVVFLNLPTLPYAHEDPDKYRFPLDDTIPYRL
jgi:dTDP-4-dehydrorhamnose 3,5-epimerase